jgi:tocopherol O-methyltransferase
VRRDRRRSGPTTAEVARHYDELDPFYRRLWGEHLHHGLWLDRRATPDQAVRALVDLVAHAAEIDSGASVCDVGCGYGATARLLATEWQAAVVGYTISERQYRVARDHPGAHPAPRYVLGDWLTNDQPSDAFDCVVAIESSEHVVDKAGFFRQVSRVLRPGGRAVVCTWLAGDAPTRWQTRWLLDPIAVEGRLAPLGRAADYRGWLAGAGLTDIAIEDLSERVAPTWAVGLRRLVRYLLTSPTPWRYLLDLRNTEKPFVRTAVRIWLGYRVGAVRYGLVSARKPPRIPADDVRDSSGVPSRANARSSPA